MKPGTKSMTRRRVPRGNPYGKRAESGWHRRARLRALLLAGVWILPGIWHAGHAIAHALEAGHHEHEVHETVSAGDRLTGLTCDDHHEHEHPDLPPVVSKEGAKKLDAPALLTAACELDSTRANLRVHAPAEVGHTPRLASADSDPRAPPIS